VLVIYRSRKRKEKCETMVKQNLKNQWEKCLSKILWGEKRKNMKRMLLLFFPKATKHGTF
jgi:hypothetical protein